MRKLNQSGFNLVELMIAVGIMAGLASSVMMARSYMTRVTVKNTDKAYATQKAVQMYEELRSLVNGNEKLGVSVLDDYSDGSKFDNVLTTDSTVDTKLPGANPADPLSANIKTNGNWRYLRQIQVNRVANDANSRQVIIKIWRYASDQNPTMTGDLLATVAGMLRTISSVFPPTQVQDVYVIAVSNIPAWWGTLPSLYPYMQSVISDIQNRNPGFQIRPHYITRSAFGRDGQYVPFTNSTSRADQIPIPWVYFYPGSVLDDNGNAEPFYDPSSNGLQQDGALNVDGTTIQPSASLFPGCPSFAVADQYNHAMRYPDEAALYKAVTAAWNTAETSSGTTVSYPFPEVSERMLLEGMISMPQSFTNAMIIQLHGELCPLPPLRNYSDPAADPGAQLGAVTQATSGDAGLRVVTHPELLYYPGSAGDAAETIRLRVYAFPDSLSAGIPVAGSKVPAISVFLPDAASTIVGVTYVYGGAGVTYQYDNMTKTGSAMSTTWTASVAGDTVSMVAKSTGPGGNQTLLTLYNTDLRCPPGSNNTGLNASDWLYNQEYIPSSPDKTTLAVQGAAPFYSIGHDLTDTTAGPGRPKNTSRWLIGVSVPITQVINGAATIEVAGQNQVIPAASSVTYIGQHSIETYIGAGVTTNVVTIVASPVTVTPNLSRTYVWTGPLAVDQPPYTEQMQYMGDPRDCPYLDVKVGGPAGSPVLAKNYNWYFKNLSGTTDGYTGFSAAGAVTGWNGAGWGSISIQDDIPKYYMTIRQALLNTTSIWATLNGWNFFYYGVGNEIGFDHAPLSNGVSTTGGPWNSGATGTAIEYGNSWSPTWGNSRDIAGTTGTWYARAWLGELYPDSLYNTWNTYGNLPTIASALAGTKFYREDYNSIAVPGTNPSTGGFGRIIGKVTSSEGSSSFFGGTASGTTGGNYYQQNSAGTNGNETSLGVTIYNQFDYFLPSVQGVTREWGINGSGAGGQPPEWGLAPYTNAGIFTTLSFPAVGGVNRMFYDSDQGGTWNGSGIVKMQTVSGGVTHVGYVLATGTSPSANVGTQDLVETALTETLRTFLDGGQMAVTGAAGHIPQIPLVELWSNAVPQFAAPASIPLVIDGAVTTGSPVTVGGSFLTIGSGPTTNMWYRFRGTTSSTGNYYTEEYPNYGSPLTQSGYTEGVSVVYNLKYSNNVGTNWYFMQDNSAAVSGVYSAAEAVTGALPITYSLSTPVANFPQGDYWFMVEAYRLDPTTLAPYNLHYAYHILDLEITR